MKRILIASVLIGAVTAGVILYVHHQLTAGRHLEDPTFDIWD